MLSKGDLVNHRKVGFWQSCVGRIGEAGIRSKKAKFYLDRRIAAMEAK